MNTVESAADKFQRFRALHRSGHPLLLPNAWDFSSAAALLAQGHPAIGTTSLGVAAAAGRVDGMAETADETRALMAAVRPMGALVTVDAEGGYAQTAAGVADFAEELHELGAVGINLEDGIGNSSLADPEHHAEKIAAVKQRVPLLFVNARTDAYWIRGIQGPLDESLRRGAIYAQAGADGFFVPGLNEDAGIRLIASTVPLPLNVLHQPGRISALASAGVSRISSGSFLFRSALQAMLAGASEFLAGSEPETSGPPPSYDDVQRLIADAASGKGWAAGHSR